MDGGTWWAAVHGVTKSQARLSDFTFTVSDSDRRVPAELGQESQASSCLRKGTPLVSRVARGRVS